MLAKGANATLPSGPVAVTVVAASPVDISALLVTASGKVRSDADFVFYNQPQAAGVRYRPDGVDVDPGAVEGAIDKVTVTASLDGRGPATFGQLGGLRLDVAVAGTPVVAFTPDGLGAETALLCVEIYRRNAEWKVRAVGQGYANGLAGIATDYGITVDEEPQAAAPAPAPRCAHEGQPGQGPGVAEEARDGVAGQDRGAGAAPGLDGAGLGPGPWGRDIDLDASAILIDQRGRKSDAVWFMGKSAYGGAIEHSGDNLTGAGEGDDETIEVDLQRLPADVVAVVFTVNSFRGQKFTDVARAYCRLLDRDSGAELVRFDLTDSEARTGVIMSVLRRAGDAWEMTAIGDFHDGKTVRAMYGHAEKLVAGLG